MRCAENDPGAGHCRDSWPQPEVSLTHSLDLHRLIEGAEFLRRARERPSEETVRKVSTSRRMSCAAPGNRAADYAASTVTLSLSPASWTWACKASATKLSGE